MEQLLADAAKQVPSLAILVVVVVKFLGAQRTQSESFASSLAQRDAAAAKVAEECHRVTTAATETISECNRALGRVSTAVERLER